MKPKPIVKGDQVGRNDDCPCGSGKNSKLPWKINDIK